MHPTPVEITTQSLIDAGAGRQLCYYADSLGGKALDWASAREYAIREFRDAPYEAIIGLIEHCKRCYSAAMECNLESQGKG